MKFTLSWLKDHLDTSASLDEISTTLTMIGLEVESVTDRAAALAPFTVAKILHAEKHPEADKLRVCRVQSDVGELQIVCGAPNARPGIFVALAKEGAVIPANGMVIRKTKIRGVESNGMLCSLEELALPGDSSGIIELPEAPIGASVATVLGLNDPVIDIAVTPNRADCLSVRGIARDLAAVGIGTLISHSPLRGRVREGGGAATSTLGVCGTTPPPPLPQGEGGSECVSPITVTIDTPNCLQFIGCYIKNVKNGASPDWMRKRLEAIGQKPISALVDITNYITFDLGRPLHVYDAKKLRGGLAVRGAKEGEAFKALNGKEYTLSAGMTVIADGSGVQALGGVIGGEASGCDAETTDVFLEVALFDPASVAQAGRALAIDSDARYRFERGVDSDFVETGAQIAVQMIREICGGEASGLVLAGNTPQWQRSIAFAPQRVKTLGGVDIEAEKSLRILSALGFSAARSAEGQYEVSPPSWRGDVDGEADLVEEILRIHGYSHIPATPLPLQAGVGAPVLNLAQKRAHLAKRTLAARGMLEVCTWSFLPEAWVKQFGGANPALKLLNPISADLDTMRPSLLPNLLDAARRNAFRGFKDLSLFEVGLQFHDVTPDGQKLVATAIHSGLTTDYTYKDSLFTHSERSADAFDAKGDALAVLETLGLSKCDITTQAPAWYHPGRSGVLTLGGKVILGYFGELHPAILSAFEIEGRVAAFELFLDAIPAPRAKGKGRPPLKVSEFQAVERDFAFTVDSAIAAAEIVRTLERADKQLITSVRMFDVYTGKGVDADKKSIAVKVILQAPDRTLSEQEISAASNAIIAAAQKGFGGQLRQ